MDSGSPLYNRAGVMDTVVFYWNYILTVFFGIVNMISNPFKCRFYGNYVHMFLVLFFVIVNTALFSN